MTAEQAFAVLAQITGLTEDVWRDFLTLPPDAQRVALENYRDQDWLRRPEKLQVVLDVLTVVGTIAGVAGTVAGAASAVAALRSL